MSKICCGLECAEEREEDDQREHMVQDGRKQGREELDVIKVRSISKIKIGVIIDSGAIWKRRCQLVIGAEAPQKSKFDVHFAAVLISNHNPNLAGLWRQLVLDREIGFMAENLYKQHREKGTVSSLEEVVNVLSSTIKELSQVFIIVKATDEYPNDYPEFQRETLLQHLAMGSNANLLITSQPNISPEAPFLNVERLDNWAAPDDI
ncbi:hypothetical protein K438DRAFT_1764525 [Mycena galopus ATCC 62051]|nr:hypothetical protein K438DRAFT_1764525 [Mycena galopus ATCC 62051]